MITPKQNYLSRGLAVRKLAQVAALYGAGLLLLVEVLLMALTAVVTASPDGRSLAERLPREVAGWRMEKRGVGETASVESATAMALQYDEAEVRIYRQGNVQIEVFVARWGAGKTSINVPAGHLPDKCWALSGWVKMRAETSDVRGEEWAWRRFQAPHVMLETLFAHSAGGVRVPYTPEGRIGYPKLLQRMFRQPFALRGEQYFVRLSSETPVVDWWAVPGFQELYADIARILRIASSDTSAGPIVKTTELFV